MGIQTGFLQGVQVLFKDLVHFQGRNGFFKASGLDIYNRSDGIIELQPLTSRGVIGNCMIQIPVESVAQVINALQTLDNQNKM